MYDDKVNLIQKIRFCQWNQCLAIPVTVNTYSVMTRVQSTRTHFTDEHLVIRMGIATKNIRLDIETFFNQIDGSISQ
jgi:hypothetical protein